MNQFLIYFWAFVTSLFCLLLLFNKVHQKLKGLCMAGALLSFLLFCNSVYTSGVIGDFMQKTKENSNWVQTVHTFEPVKEDSDDKNDIKDSVSLDIPIISQLPELPRGCEVTSLSMLLKYAGVKVDKMELAQRIKRDPTPYQKVNGQVFFGNPNVGFVGDMYNIHHSGLGVYHKPIKKLADEYLPNKMIDLTGKEFSELETSLSSGIPVWVIINTKYKKLPSEEFRTWNTSAGQIQITYSEHSVLVTGYDEDYVYVNDPLTVEKNKRVPKQEFIQAWIQMGRQAVTYLKKDQ